MKAIELLKKTLKVFKTRTSVVRRIVIIHEPDDQKRDRIERRLEKLGYQIDYVSDNAIYINLRCNCERQTTPHQ